MKTAFINYYKVTTEAVYQNYAKKGRILIFAIAILSSKTYHGLAQQKVLKKEILGCIFNLRDTR